MSASRPAAIAENPGLSQSDLVRATGIDRSTLADMMNRMQKRGWVLRTASVSDARALSVRLAAAGSSPAGGPVRERAARSRRAARTAPRLSD